MEGRTREGRERLELKVEGVGQRETDTNAVGLEKEGSKKYQRASS